MKTNYSDDVDYSLETLGSHRVVKFEREGNTFVITEACDEHFDAVLTREEFATFISDLQELYERKE